MKFGLAYRRTPAGRAGLFCALTLLFVQALQAQTTLVNWIGGSGNWSTATNWSTGVVPGPTNDVVIPAGAAITVTHSAGTDTVNSILSLQALVISGGSLTVVGNVQVNNFFTLAGGTLAGATILPATNGASLVISNNSATLSGVTINGTLDLGNTVSGAVLNVTNGLTVAGTFLVGNPTNNNWGRASFSGSQTLGGSGTVVFGNNGNNWIYPANTNSALTIGTGLTVRGQTGSIGVAPFAPIINKGRISCDVTNGIITVGAASFTNTNLVQAINGGSLSITTLQNSVGANVVIYGGGTLTLGGSWNNAGTIDATNSIVDLGGTFSVTNLAVFNQTNGTVNLTGTLVNSNAVLALSPVTGSWVLNNGTVQGGTILTSNGASFIVSSGTMDGVTVNGTLDLGNTLNGAGLTVTNGLTVGGTFLVGNPTNNNWGRANFTGSQTLGGNGTVVFGNNGNNWLYPPNTNSTLTIGPSLTVRGNTGSVGIGSGPVVNQGVISCDVTNGTFTINALPFSNQGMVQAINGGSIAITELQNGVGADVVINGGGTLNLLGPWNNAGTIDATNSIVDLGGTFTVSNLAVFNRVNGTVNLTGTLLNSNAVLALGPVTGLWVLNNGTVQGGTIMTSNGASFIVSSGTFDGVTVNGTLDVGNTVNGAGLSVTNGLTLSGTMLMGNPTNSSWGRANFTGSQTLGGSGTVIFGNDGNNWLYPPNTNSTLTIGSGITVRGNTGSVGVGLGPVVNQGVISCDVTNGTFTINALPFSNQSVVQAINGGSIVITELQNGVGADVVINGGGTLNLLGPWNNAGTIDATNSIVDLGGTFTVSNLAVFNRVNGTVNLTGTLVNSNAVLALGPVTGSWVLNNGTVQGGTIMTSNGASFIVNNGTFDGVTVNGTLDVGNTVNGAGLSVTNGLTLSGTMLMGNPTNSSWGRAGMALN